MRIHLYLNSQGLESYRAGREVWARVAPSDDHIIHVDVDEREAVQVMPNFFEIRGKGK